MAIIANDLPRFDEDIQDYGAANEKLKEHFSQMVNHMNDLNSMWEGEAHNQLMSTFSADREKTLEMIENLQKVLNELMFAHSEYTSCENNVAGIIDSISV